jgi:FkbM family methyltransferase
VGAVKIDGWKGAWLATTGALFCGVPWGVRLPSLGLINHRAEVLNYLDNFCLGELRCAEVEKHLAGAAKPVIVDLGINVGLTVRWWSHLNPQSRIIGIDMLEEALAFAGRKLKDFCPGASWHPIGKAIGDGNFTLEASITNPLEGSTSLKTKSAGPVRKIEVTTLDSVIAPLGLTAIDLLKIDIEGYGGRALAHAGNTLRMTKYVVFETHDREETQEASEALGKAGFVVFHIFGRTMWLVASGSVQPSA